MSRIALKYHHVPSSLTAFRAVVRQLTDEFTAQAIALLDALGPNKLIVGSLLNKALA